VERRGEHNSMDPQIREKKVPEERKERTTAQKSTLNFLLDKLKKKGGDMQKALVAVAATNGERKGCMSGGTKGGDEYKPLWTSK